MLRPCAILLLTCGCSHTPGAASKGAAAKLASAPGSACVLSVRAPSADLIRRHGTILDAYQLEGGVWLERAPVLINEDFDFALAMGLEGGVGAGLAAAKRKENNAKKAAALAGIAVPPELQRRLAELRCCGVHVYFVLWGAEGAVLRTVADVPSDRGTSRVVESAGCPLRGDAGWTAERTLATEAQRALTDFACPAAATGSGAGAGHHFGGHLVAGAQRQAVVPEHVGHVVRPRAGDRAPSAAPVHELARCRHSVALLGRDQLL